MRLAKALSEAIVETLDCPNFDLSVGIEDVSPADWAERVYRRAPSPTEFLPRA